MVIDSSPVWRSIPPLTLPGALQMAIDRRLLQQHFLGLHPPTLRFYRWSSPTVSLGYHQRRYPPEWDHLYWRGAKIPLVRRPTGGRAVLHGDDLTYSLITSNIDGDLSQVYETICNFLVTGWRELGLELDYGGGGRDYRRSTDCFSLATGADLVDGEGRKFIGSALLKRGKFILQQGSIRLGVDRELYGLVFGCPPPEIVPLPELTLETIVSTLKGSARRHFGIELEERHLSEAEWRDSEKYSLQPIDN